MIRQLLAAVALLVALPTAAQNFTSDPATGTYVPIAATYESGTKLNVLGDGSDTKGGIAPAFTLHPEPADPTDNADSLAWLRPNSASDYCRSGATVDCQEKKARFIFNSCLKSFKRDDPARFWGQPGASHLHEFFNNCEVNAFSTHISLRKRLGVGVGPGGDLILTAYWEPAWQKVIASKLYAMPSDLNIGYYQEEARLGEPLVDDLQFLHALFRFVGGVNPDDPFDAKVKKEIADANAQPGTAGRYSYLGNGFAGYVCLLSDGSAALVKGGGTHSAGFTLIDDTDPWEGRCVAGSQIYAEGNAPPCWDATNVTSPGATLHVRYAIFDAIAGKAVCPNHWAKVPTFQLKTMHRTQGWSDYRTWKLSSDPMMAAMLGIKIVPGASFHFDWMNGGHHRTMHAWQSFGLGIGTNEPHALNDNTISATQALITGSPAPNGKRNPQVDMTIAINTNDPSQLHLVDTARAPMVHIH